MDNEYSSTWASDAAAIESSDTNSIIFRNGGIDRYLNETNQFFVSGNKGLGKTLLLKTKRHRISTDFPSYRFIPADKPYLDLMGGGRDLSSNQKGIFDDPTQAQKLWSFAIRLSILLHERIPNVSIVEISRQLGLENRKSPPNPTTVFRSFFNNTSVREIHALINGYENDVDQLVEGIHTGVAVFIDKVDQGIYGLSAKQWTNVQAGLVAAAFSIFETNNHLKIYATIRQEAFSNYNEPYLQNFIGHTLEIQYSQQELTKLIDHLFKVYEKNEGLVQFLKFSELDKNGNGIPEKVFEYLFRHTVGRPRDLVTVASRLSANRLDMNEETYRRIVNETTSQIAPSVFTEGLPFMRTLVSVDHFETTLSQIRTNILSSKDIEILAERLPILTTVKGRIDPAGDLFSAGLLGYIKSNAEGSSQIFKLPKDFISTNKVLPESEFYLVHPSLQAKIDAVSDSSYNVIPHIVIGHGYPWLYYYESLAAVYRLLWKLGGTRDMELFGLVDRAVQTKKDFSVKELDKDGNMMSSGSWSKLRLKLEKMNLDDLHLALQNFVETESPL